LLQAAVLGSPFVEKLAAFHCKHADEGVAWFEKHGSLPLFSRDLSFWDHLGDIYERLGKKDQARQAWRKSLEMFPATTEPDDHRKKRLKEKLGPS
jgi:hypothetical protein